MGSIYLRGKTWWIKYYRKGKPYFESTGSPRKMVARKLLELREGEKAQGKLPGIQFDNVRFDELAEDFLTDYRVNGKKSLVRAELSLKHLKGEFEGARIPEITTPKIQKYVEKRLNEGAANASINRELSALKRILTLGARQTPAKVQVLPYIRMLKEDNVRKGFFEHGDFLALRDALPEYLKGLVTFGYKTGWRIAEIENLSWKEVDLEHGTVRLNPGETKNSQGRIVYLDDEIKAIFSDSRKRDDLIPYVFLNRDKSGKITDIRKAWNTACKKAGIGKRLFHDLRRTAVRNMIRAGVPERVAMMISGHKTRSVFDRYNIVSSEDLKNASSKQEAYLKNQKTVTKTVTIREIGDKKRG